MATVSINELMSTTRKVVEIYHYHWGSETDIAELVCWLELNQLDGLNRLRRLIDNQSLSNAQSVSYKINDRQLNIEAGGQSAFLFALACLDLAMGLTTEPKTHQQKSTNQSCLTVNISDVSDGIVFVPAVALKTGMPPVTITGADNTYHFNATIDDNLFTVNQVTGLDNNDLQVQIGDIDIQTNTVKTDSTSFSKCGNTTNQLVVENRKTQIDALANGVTVEDGVWQSLLSDAKRILVPASTRSRRYGTGGGDAND